MSENRKSTSNVMLVSKKSQIKSMINALYIHQDSLGTNSILIQISDQKIQILHTQQQSDPKINIQEIKEKENLYYAPSKYLRLVQTWTGPFTCWHLLSNSLGWVCSRTYSWCCVRWSAYMSRTRGGQSWGPCHWPCWPVCPPSLWPLGRYLSKSEHASHKSSPD